MDIDNVLFSDDKTEVHKTEFVQGHTANKWQNGF